MGIEYFSDFIRDHAPNCYFEIPLENFKGQRIAIDTNNEAFREMAIAIKEVTDSTNLANEKPDRAEINRRALDKIVSRLIIFLENGITPVPVFDSKAHPLKEHGKAKRKASAEKIKQKLLEAEKNLYNADKLFRTQSLVNEYAKYYKQVVEVSYEFMNQLYQLLASVGFPVLSAADFNLETKDAEGICAGLCLKGNDYCIATLSTDSDYHTYGGNNELVEIFPKYVTVGQTRVHKYFARVRSLEVILNQSGLSFEAFRDLCILMGSDFNPNISGIGPKRSWEYIIKYGSITEISKVIDTSILRYSEVLKIFGSAIIKINISTPDFDVQRFREHGRNMFDLYALKDYASIIADALDSFTPIPTTIKIEPNDNSLLTSVSTVSQSLSIINL